MSGMPAALKSREAPILAPVSVATGPVTVEIKPDLDLRPGDASACDTLLAGRPCAGVFLSMPWQGTGPDGVPFDAFIWGATAAMLRNLYAYLAR